MGPGSVLHSDGPAELAEVSVCADAGRAHAVEEAVARANGEEQAVCVEEGAREEGRAEPAERHAGVDVLGESGPMGDPGVLQAEPGVPSVHFDAPREIIQPTREAQAGVVDPRAEHGVRDRGASSHV